MPGREGMPTAMQNAKKEKADARHLYEQNRTQKLSRKRGARASGKRHSAVAAA